MAWRLAKIGIPCLLVVAGLLVWLLLIPAPTEEELLLDLAEDALEAELDRDYEEIWDLIGEKARGACAERLAWFMSLDPGVPGDAEHLATMESSVGVRQEDIRDMDPEEWFAAVSEGDLRSFEPKEMLRTLWSDLEIGEVMIFESSDLATVDLGKKMYDGREFSRGLSFRKVDGEWCYQHIGFCHMKFRTLDRKFAAYLPRVAVGPDDVEVVIEVGPATAGEELTQLREWLAKTFAERGGRFTVLIDAAPQASVQRVVGVIDTVRGKQHFEMLFTRRAERDGVPRPGIRVNGVPLPEAVEGASYTTPADHPATRRILTLQK